MPHLRGRRRHREALPAPPGDEQRRCAGSDAGSPRRSTLPLLAPRPTGPGSYAPARSVYMVKSIFDATDLNTQIVATSWYYTVVVQQLY